MIRPAAPAREHAASFRPPSGLAPLLAAAVLGFGLGAVQAQPAKKVDVAKGQQIASQVCAACHGADGNAPSPANPKLAGQHADYLLASLRAWRDGDRRTDPSGQMPGIARRLPEPDLQAVAKYFSGLAPGPSGSRRGDAR